MPHLLRILLASAALSAGPAFSAPDGTPDEPGRGRALYEMRCLGCHDQSVHGRKNRTASDFGAVRAWVARWNETLSAGWSEEEIDDVARYLNGTYYRYPCPPSVCKVISLIHVKPGPALPTTLE